MGRQTSEVQILPGSSTVYPVPYQNLRQRPHSLEKKRALYFRVTILSTHTATLFCSIVDYAILWKRILRGSESHQNKCVEFMYRGLTTAACGSALKAGGTVRSRMGVGTSVLGQHGAPHFRKAVRKKIKPPWAIRGIMRTRKRDPEETQSFRSLIIMFTPLTAVCGENKSNWV